MLPWDTLVALVVFTFVGSITPGPNNLMLMASGVNFGLRRTVPQMCGIDIGFVVMVLLVGAGFGQLFALAPWLHIALKIVGLVYMLFLAWKTASAGGARDSLRTHRPMTFLQAAAFQWVNPKAWAVIVSAVAAYTVPDGVLVSVLTIALVFGLVSIPSIACWTMFGMSMRRFLSNPRAVHRFNIAMALLLVASLYPAALDLLALVHAEDGACCHFGH